MIKYAERLKGVNPRLQQVVQLAATLCPIDIYVIEGVRSIERQRELVAAGKSKTMNSRHLNGGAVDLWDGKSWEREKFMPIRVAMLDAAARLRVDITHGADWNRNGIIEGGRDSWDYPHWQIEV